MKGTWWKGGGEREGGGRERERERAERERGGGKEYCVLSLKSEVFLLSFSWDQQLIQMIIMHVLYMFSVSVSKGWRTESLCTPKFDLIGVWTDEF